MPPIGYPGNSISKEARAKAGGGFESAIEVASESLQSGQSITVTGSGFGAVSNPNPTAYDTFNDYSYAAENEEILVGSDSEARWGEISAFGDPYQFDSSAALPGRQYCAKSVTRKAYLADPYTAESGPSRVRETIYSTFMVRWNEDVQKDAQSGTGISFKILRTWHTSDSVYSSLIMQSPATLSSPNDTLFYGPRPWDDNGKLQWHRVEVYYSPTENFDSPNAEFEGDLYIDGEYRGSVIVSDEGRTPASGTWKTRLIGSDPSIQDNLNETLRHWLAEFYEQPTRERIEISNNATFDTSSTQKRYYQRCTSRTDNQVVIPDVFLADLDSNDPIYLHAVKDDNTVTTVQLVVGSNVEIN